MQTHQLRHTHVATYITHTHTHTTHTHTHSPTTAACPPSALQALLPFPYPQPSSVLSLQDPFISPLTTDPPTQPHPDFLDACDPPTSHTLMVTPPVLTPPTSVHQTPPPAPEDQQLPVHGQVYDLLYTLCEFCNHYLCEHVKPSSFATCT